MKYLRSLMVITFLFTLLAPTIYSSDVQAAPRNKTNQEMKEVADPIMDNILKGVQLENYMAYSKDFDQPLKVLGSRTKFFQVARYLKQTVGNYMYREYMGSLHKDDLVVVLWKATFDKTQDDVLIKLFLTKQNNRYVVKGLRFQ
ncbi:MAG: hypothetical protein KJ915_05185 [Candidatus Omnitrophica bacterium]|nr:hypothetical protein [Candidatus Omnitrophota bacterium]